MAIIFDEQNKTFTIHTEHSTYQMQIDPYGVLLHLYYGRKTKGCMDYLLQKQDRGFSGNLYDAGNDRTYSLDVLPQEFPTWGTGDYRSTALIVRGQDGTTACDLRYRGYRILSGKYGLCKCSNWFRLFLSPVLGSNDHQCIPNRKCHLL